MEQLTLDVDMSEVHDVIKQCRQKLIDKGRYTDYVVKIPTALNVNWNLKGAVAGKAFSKNNEIRLNYALFLKNKEEFLKQTVPHEWCHIAAGNIFGFNITPHGVQWCYLMELLGLEPKRCHNYDTSEVKRHRTVTYYSVKCNCKTHRITSTLVKRIRSGRRYWCKRCKGDLKI